MGYSLGMQLFINGAAKSVDGIGTLAELIDHLGMKGDRVAVELNREIVARAQWSATDLHDGDRLEIVHFVGGGAKSSRCYTSLVAGGFSLGGAAPACGSDCCTNDRYSQMENAAEMERDTMKALPPAATSSGK